MQRTKRNEIVEVAPIKYFCTSCGMEMLDGLWGEVCEDCEERYGNPDFAPEQFCNMCGQDLTESGGICDFCLGGGDGGLWRRR